jgi:hypothetical protein
MGIGSRMRVDITTEDSDAWQWYPAHRWVYEKTGNRGGFVP